MKTHASFCLVVALVWWRASCKREGSESLRATRVVCNVAEGCRPKACWAEAHEKIARMTLTIKLDRNWSSFQLANSAPPLSVTDSAIAPSARMKHFGLAWDSSDGLFDTCCFKRWFR